MTKSVAGGVCRIAILVVDGDIGKGQTLGSVNTEPLYGSVLESDARDSRGGQAVSVKELGLGFATVGALTVPPLATVAIKN